MPMPRSATVTLTCDPRRTAEMAIVPPSELREDVPRELDAIVMTALDRDLAGRWQTARAMHGALVEFAREHGELDGAKLHAWVTWALQQQPRTEDSVTSSLELPTAVHSRRIALLITGDGGWAQLDKEVSAALEARGVPVVGLNSLKYFWGERTKEALDWL